ncbi:MAG: PA0069 family radical SAM protein [Steroidobacteraceae bacterium]|jgi:DNA repair photolyase|nr:PA0069 family radical SAM protein [Steroidobacteraceae bacterium]
MPTRSPPPPGRGALSRPPGRFARTVTEAVDDGWEAGSDDPADALPDSTAISVLPEHARSIVTRNDSPDIMFDQSINPYRGCEHACVYCLDGATRVLMADGRTRPIAELEAGARVIGTSRSGHYRRYVPTVITARWVTRKPAFRVSLADGTQLVASGDHRFLTERGWKFVANDPVKPQRPRLTLDNSLMGIGHWDRAPRLADVEAYRRGYLCGVIRGDGHLAVHRRARPDRGPEDRHTFRLAMADGQALERAAAYLSGFGVSTDSFLFSRRSSARAELRAIRCSSRRAVEAVFRLVAWPPIDDPDWMRGFVSGMFDAGGSAARGVVRLTNTDDTIIGRLRSALCCFGFESVLDTPRPGVNRPVQCLRVRGGLAAFVRFVDWFDPSIDRKRLLEGMAVKSSAALEVVNIEPLPGRRELVDITTGTGDFIANGVISHNCYARPSHAYVDLSPGIDFETRLFYKVDAARLLEQELAKPHYVCKPIMLGANTDPYQPIEKRLRVTRSVLEVLARARHPVAVVTKGALLERDLDLLADLARDGLARVALSLPTLDPALKRILEPRAASPAARLRLMRRLADAGVPVSVLVAPVIPVLTDHEVERVLEASAAAGASRAGYVLLRLPHEVKTLFREWLEAHFPDTAAHVMSRVAAMRDGRDNDPAFGTRMRGQGVFAALLRQRFATACRRLGLDTRHELGLATHLFRRPSAAGAAAAGQLSLDF